MESKDVVAINEQTFNKVLEDIDCLIESTDLLEINETDSKELSCLLSLLCQRVSTLQKQYS